MAAVLLFSVGRCVQISPRAGRGPLTGEQSPATFSPPAADEKQGQQQGEDAAAAQGDSQHRRRSLIQRHDLPLDRGLKDQIAAVQLSLHTGPAPVLIECGVRVLRPSVRRRRVTVSSLLPVTE